MARTAPANPASESGRLDDMVLKRLILQLLAWSGLLGPAYRAYERLRALRSRDSEVESPDGLPVPPSWLRIRVAGTPDAKWFLESGRLSVKSIRRAIGDAGVTLEQMRSILDFGCGCGRVIRHLSSHPGALYGSDFNGDAIRWCQEHLLFARFEPNDLGPPLAYSSQSIDFIYAISVFTHLPVDLQHQWIDELARALRPGGLLLLTTHGEAYLPRLSRKERARFWNSEVVVRFRRVAGTNLCTAFHPRQYVKEVLGARLTEIQFYPKGAMGSPHQDLYLFRKPEIKG
jgi:SAM-dependent methyltransferase